MNLKFNLSHALRGVQVFWMREDKEQKVSVLAVVHDLSKKSRNETIAKRMASRAEKIARQEAQKIGKVVSVGVFMGGNGQSFKVTGLADMNWSPEIEKKLVLSGLQQIY